LRAVQIKANLRERNIDGTQNIAKQDRAPDDATGMIEVLSQQLRPVPGGDSQILRAGTSRAAEDEEGPSNALPC
jgi:hypothetical protein